MYQHELHALGTQIHIQVADSAHATAAVATACTEVQRIEQAYSRFLQQNQLSTLNAKIGMWQTVSAELFALLRIGAELERLSDGSFSLSIKSVLDSWGYNERYELGTESAAGKTSSFELREGTHEVRLGAPVEIGALGKGYAIERMQAVLQAEEHLCINAGGDIYARGTRDGAPWVFFLEHPDNTELGIGEVILDNAYLAGSSPAARSWRDRHHLVDARQHEPARDMQAVWVQADSGTLADGYATMLFVMGYERACKLAAQQHIAALLIGPAGEISRTPSFQGKLYRA